jgi:alkyl sulfatase BDS1-like metallo-beta-lactamase superfamily hydrolase
MPRFTLSPHGLLACLITACLAQSVYAADAPVAASAQTAASNSAVLQQLPFSDRIDYESVGKGLIAPFKGQVKDASGKVIWDGFRCSCRGASGRLRWNRAATR